MRRSTQVTTKTDRRVKRATRSYVVDSAKPSQTTPPAQSGVSVGPDSANGKKTEKKPATAKHATSR